MQISKNFSLAELLTSQTAVANRIGNIPNEAQVVALQYLVEKVLQPARDKLAMPLHVSSGFRSERLNDFIGGSPTSQHMKGEAADLQCDDNAKLFHFIKENLTFDQLIWEMGNNDQPHWVHVSITETGLNRFQVFRAVKENGKTKYYGFV